MELPNAFDPGIKNMGLHIVRIIPRQIKCSFIVYPKIKPQDQPQRPTVPCQTPFPNIYRISRRISRSLHNPQSRPSSSSLHPTTFHSLAPFPTTSRCLSIFHSAYIAAVALAAFWWPGVRPAFSASALARQMQVARFRPVGSGVPNQYLAC